MCTVTVGHDRAGIKAKEPKVLAGLESRSFAVVGNCVLTLWQWLSILSIAAATIFAGRVSKYFNWF